ncbi:MAG: hypothetical protein JXQ96_09335 [Cyclobacteriaceae bacterium]
MFTEYEIETLITSDKVKDATTELKKQFIKAEAPFLEISDADFFSLIMLTPTIGVALANGSVSLFEEMALNKKARKLSKGGYFLKKDPVVFAQKFLINKYDQWEEKFLDVIKRSMDESLDMQSLRKDFDPNQDVDYEEYKREVLRTPYIFIRFVASFFMEEDEDIINNTTMSKTDHGRLVEIGEKLGLSDIPVFHYFQKHITIK